MNLELVYVKSRGLRLVGDLLHAEDDALVMLCHGFTSDRRSRGRFPAVMQGLASKGISSLAFDFAGCGDSDDDILTLEGQVADLLEVLSWARAQGFKRLGMYGHSLGGLVALLAAAKSQVQALAVSGAPIGPMNYDWQAFYSPESIRLLEREGVIALPAPRPGGTVMVDHSLLVLLGQFHQETDVPFLDDLACFFLDACRCCTGSRPAPSFLG